MDYPCIYSLFKRLSKKLKTKITPHMLRHTHATELIRHGWDTSFVQQRLGHTSAQTTLNIYTHLNTQDLKSAYLTYLKQKEGKEYDPNL